MGKEIFGTSGNWHTISNLLNGFTGYIYYMVKDRICYVALRAIKNPNSYSAICKVTEDMPKCKLEQVVDGGDVAAAAFRFYLDRNQTYIMCGYYSHPNVEMYCNFAYPVSDEYIG